jgi:hypothetical protein
MDKNFFVHLWIILSAWAYSEREKITSINSVLKIESDPGKYTTSQGPF